MGNIGDTISDTAPIVGTSGPGYATTINSLLTELRARLVAKIPLSSLLTNSNLDLNGQALLNAAYITMMNEAVSPVSSPFNRIAAYAGDLWWVSPSGAVKITSGASINAAGVGGITGDYTSAGPMQFRYDSGNTRYDAFANQGTNTWAYVRGLGFDIAGGATSNFRARLLFGGGANVAYTLPSAAPAAAQVVTMDATGAMAVDGVLGTNSNITLAGTGKVKHGTYTLSCALRKFLASGSATVSDNTTKSTINVDNGTAYIPLALNWNTNWRLKTVFFEYTHTGAGSISYEVVQSPQTGGTNDFVSLNTPTSTTTAAGSGTKTLTLTGSDGLPGFNLGTDYVVFYLKVTAPVSNNVTLAAMRITYDTP